MLAMSHTRRLSGGILWTLLSYALPMASAVLIVPILIRRMGTDSFGLLSFIWMVVAIRLSWISALVGP